ncbi:putative two-component response regulator-like APRR4 [Bidens hawaiensis]|uniref:putative two-component response regulator-like APRR4 n=1 Tax=Bidens hawaiensis TaxID=980011 RepID=UPI0040496DC5
MNNGFNNNILETSILGNGIKVMVIDHKQNFLVSVCEILKSRSFEVTCVDEAGDALRVLAAEKEKYDLLLIASDMKGVDALTFLKITKNMDLLSMVMQQETDDEFLLKVLENGGFRVVKTPLTDDAVMYARDDVIRARFQKFERSKVLGESEAIEVECESRPKRTLNSGVKKNKIKKRFCIIWTKEIHDKFLQVIRELGEGRCFPRDICDAMGVPGLTRLQVASHLQRCRLGECKFLKKKGETCFSISKKMVSGNLPKEVDPEMLGKNPSASTHVENHDEVGMNIDGLYTEGKTYINQSIEEISSVNGIGFEDFAEGYYVPTDFNLDSFPSNEVSTDSFEFLNGLENPSLDGMEFNVSGQNHNMHEQDLPHADQVMDTEGVSKFNQHI